MKKAAILALLQEKGDDDEVDSILMEELKKVNINDPPNKPTEINKDIKADTTLTMTAAEFMQLIDKLNPKKEEKKEEKNAEIFI